jgi:hypothetical protein
MGELTFLDFGDFGFVKEEVVLVRAVSEPQDILNVHCLAYLPIQFASLFHDLIERAARLN